MLSASRETVRKDSIETELLPLERKSLFSFTKTQTTLHHSQSNYLVELTNRTRIFPAHERTHVPDKMLHGFWLVYRAPVHASMDQTLRRALYSSSELFTSVSLLHLLTFTLYFFTAISLGWINPPKQVIRLHSVYLTDRNLTAIYLFNFPWIDISAWSLSTWIQTHQILLSHELFGIVHSAIFSNLSNIGIATS